jgi:hypothetical protein
MMYMKDKARDDYTITSLASRKCHFKPQLRGCTKSTRVFHCIALLRLVFLGNKTAHAQKLSSFPTEQPNVLRNEET